MDNKWLELHISVPAAAVDLVCAGLATLGSTGVRVFERQLDTFVAPDPDADAPESYPLRAYFPAEQDGDALLKCINEALGPLRAMFAHGWSEARLEAVSGDDWSESWKQHFPVFRVGKLVVRPSWEEVTAAPDEALLTLDPGMAFGTGTHATTRLCLEALVATLDTLDRAPRVLDVGTGSGILAIAAAMLGAGEVVACDLDAEACRVAQDNAAANGMAAAVEITSRPLEELGAGFDIVLANILAEENVRLAGELVARLAPGATLILSGILREKESLARRGFAPFGLEGPRLSERDEWICLTYRRAD
ncbi:50S ribosomal protein L11 methyltransferase [Geoalkalibacter halelectricus]|uniref:Ribosomal protein L11 methyltransferase n=2 Tax=Geoalkalibacter halelectricus TaxID=2847045 RepID=A0ABY5ZSE6_9BACT|nr:50S ribosomal protein L11 methyltransferase [Geoalkalibacter halelectricus]MDO3378535.1 50S ribosomal protein L11 methyltransferase [Geoalkalibacter halelectricus]UWZ80151.1 50S ribosomal protein L11 methyltransferase [Geoalkalibacter halelectricus]